MNPPLAELSLLTWACYAALPLLMLHATAPSQSRPDAETSALLAKIDAARGKPKKPVTTLSIEGTFAVTIPGSPGGDEVAKGGFREIFDGTDFARSTSELGEHGAMENGITPDLSWGLDPAMGPKVHTGAQAVVARRFSAIMRGASPRDLYRRFERTGTQQLGEREHAVLRMTPAEGKPDTWYVDPEGHVARIDTMLVPPESADATWDMGDWVATELTFGDWREVNGVRYPFFRQLKMGPATMTFTCAKIETGVQIAPERFTPPEAVLKLKGKPAARPVDADGKPTYEIIEREAQPVASIRLKCKANEISATLAEIFPEVMQHLNATGAKMVGAPFSRYHSFGDTEVDLEAGIPVSKPFTEKGRVKNSELPAGKAVTAWHIGPYDKLGEAHKALSAWLTANKLESRGGPWEVYWTDPGMVPDSSKWRTQLFMPIAQ